MFKGFNDEVHMCLRYVARGMVKRSSSAGHGSCLRFSDRGLTGKSQFLPHGYRRFIQLARQRLCRELICRDMRYSLPASTNAAWPPACWQTTPTLPAHRPDTAPARYDKPASPIHAVIQTYRQTLHRAAFQAAYVGKPSCTTQRVLHSVYTSRSCRLSCTASRPSAPSHLSWGHRQHIGIFVGFAGDLLDGPSLYSASRCLMK